MKRTLTLARHRGKSPVTTSPELYHFYRTWESPRRCFEVTFQLNRAAFVFLSVNKALRAVKLDGKCNEAHKDLIRHHYMSPVATSAELHHVYRTWNPPRR